MEIPQLKDIGELKKWLVALNTAALVGARKHGATEIKLEVRFSDGKEWHDICRVAPKQTQ